MSGLVTILCWAAFAGFVIWQEVRGIFADAEQDPLESAWALPCAPDPELPDAYRRPER